MIKTLYSGSITITKVTTTYSAAYYVSGESVGVHIKVKNLNLSTITLTFLEGNDLIVEEFGNKLKDQTLSTPFEFILNNGYYSFNLKNITNFYIGFKINPGTNTLGDIAYTIIDNHE